MSTALYALGRAAFRARRLVLAGWLLLVVLLGLLTSVVGQGTNNNFSVPGTESESALEALGRTFPQVSGTTGQLVVVAPKGHLVTDPAARHDIAAALTKLDRLDHVSGTVSPFDKRIKGGVSDSKRAAIAQVQFDVPLTGVTQADKDGLVAAAASLRSQGYQAQAGGQAFTNTGPAVSASEVIGVVVAFLVLLLTFGALVPALMPIVTALVGVAVSMTITLSATRFIDISSTTPLLGLMIGLAVGIDYALFIVTRHREQLDEGLEPEEAAARAVATAGSAVVFAGLTVVIALLGLSVAGIPFLRTMGIFAAIAVAVAVCVALTLLPALFGFAGRRMHPSPRLSRRRGMVARRWVRGATRWPLVSVVVVIVGLAVVASPGRHLDLALPDNGTAVAGTPQREAYDLTVKEFGAGYTAPLIVSADIITTTDPVGVMDKLGADVARVPGVHLVALATPDPGGDTGIVQIVPDHAAGSSQTADLVQRLRDKEAGWDKQFGIQTAVTGQTAVQIDVSHKLRQALLPFALLVVGISLVLLAAVFRSWIVPIKATLGYLLSVGASFGAVVAVFQWGWLMNLANVDHTGPVISFLPIILMGVLFGLAMDYEVFLVSRMKEEFSRSGDAGHAIEEGFVGSSRVVTAAAVIMISVFGAFIPEGDASVKPIALALAVGVFVDAFLVRMVFVPAVLKLVGAHAWRLPAMLDRVLPDVDVEGRAVEQVQHLEDWPREGAQPAIAAENLGLDGPDGTVFAGVDLLVEPGQWLVVRGAEGSGRTSLLLTLAGRMPFGTGRLKVLGELLPQGRRTVRHQVALGEVAGVNPLEDVLSVDQHIAERLSGASFGLWVSGAKVKAVRDDLVRVLDAAAERTGVEPLDSLSGREIVRDLRPLVRLVLSARLAMVSGPRMIVLDDIDDVRSADDLALLWAALDLLTTEAGVTVVVSSHAATPLPDRPGLQVVGLEPHRPALSHRHPDPTPEVTS